MRKYTLLSSFIYLLLATILPVKADTALYAKLKGKVLGILSEGDQNASSYVDGLIPKDHPRKDILTLVRLNGDKPAISSIEASNSVTATPESMALSADGKYAYVVERLKQKNEGAVYFWDLRPGNILTIIDISKPDAPRVTDKVTLANNPESVRVSPDGRYVAVPSNTGTEAIIQIISVANGKSDGVFSFKLADLGIKKTKGQRGGITQGLIDWHPSSKAIAINIYTRDEVAFYKLDGDDKNLKLVPWGKPVKVGKDPYVGRFIPGGRYYVTSDWGRNLDQRSSETRLPKVPSEISVVRLDDLSTGSEAIHQKVGSTKTGRSAEGIAVSPDGRFIVTSNMRETIIWNSKRFTKEASVSLLTFDPETGKIQNVGNTLYEGVLPEGITFDASGEYVLAAVFEYHRPNEAKGGLEVFRITKGDKPELKHVGTIPSLRGTHHVEIAH